VQTIPIYYEKKKEKERRKRDPLPLGIPLHKELASSLLHSYEKKKKKKGEKNCTQDIHWVFPYREKEKKKKGGKGKRDEEAWETLPCPLPGGGGKGKKTVKRETLLPVFTPIEKRGKKGEPTPKISANSTTLFKGR